MKNKTIATLLLLIFLAILLLGLVEADPSLVGTSTTNYALTYAHQRKCFYANGRFWVFWCNGSYMVYASSADGSTWTSPTAVRDTDFGHDFSVWWDGTYFHYAHGAGSSLHYRRGIPNADGTITWSISEQTISTVYNHINYPYISIGSNGYIWILYRDEGSSSSIYPYVIYSTDNGTSWSTPYRLNDVSSAYWTGSIVPLTDGKMLAVYHHQQSPVYVRLWNGSWQAEKATTSLITSRGAHSVVAYGDVVHIAFLENGTSAGKYVKYDATSDSLSSEITLIASGLPRLTVADSGTLYCFYGADNHIYYKTSTDSGDTWSSPVDWIDETTETLRDLSVFYKQYGDYIGVVYRTGTESPYNIKFAYLTTNTPPNAPTLDSPAENAHFDPSASVTFSWTFSDPDAGDNQSAYQFQLDDNSDFSSPIIDTGKVISSTSSTTQTLPSAVGLYYWRVKTWDSSDAEGVWSSGRAIIVDKVEITLSVADSRIDIGTAMSWNFTAIYAYDGADATSHVSVTLNDTETKNAIGKYYYTADSITDSLYGLTVFECNVVYVIFDRVNFTLSAVNERVDVGKEASITVSAVYAYDGSTFEGTYSLNDTLTKSEVGKYGFKVASMTDTLYGLTVFTTNEISIVWDMLNITFTASDCSPDLGEQVVIYWNVTRVYDGSAVTDYSITVLRNGTSWISDASYGEDVVPDGSGMTTLLYNCSVVTDNLYGLTAFTQSPITITWHYISKPYRALNTQLQNEGNPYIVESTHLVTSLSYSSGRLTYEVNPVSSLAVTAVKSLGYIPRMVYVDGVGLLPEPSRSQFNSKTGVCWYYDEDLDIVYVKVAGSTVEIEWHGYVPSPAPAPTPTPAPMLFDVSVFAPHTVLIPQPLTVEVTVFNPTCLTADATLKWRLLDSQNRTVAEGTQIVMVSPMHSSIVKVTVSPTWTLKPGTYRFEAWTSTPIKSNVASQTVNIMFPTEMLISTVLFIIILASAIILLRRK